MNSSHEEEFYPMPAFPTLSVNDLMASTQWYQDVLGFRREMTILDPDGYRLIFTQRADENVTMEQTIKNVTQQTGGHVKVD